LKILVTGAAGMLGQAVVATPCEHELVGVDLPDADLTSANDIEALFGTHKPNWVVHCAAYTDVDGAEEARDLAQQVNAGATTLLAAACDRFSAGLTAVSTDYVFAGTNPEGYDETDPRDPVNHYGATKAGAEEAVEGMSAPGQIVRTSWLFGPGPKNFVLTIRRLLRSRPELKVVDDQRGCPTYAPDLARVLIHLAGTGIAGHYHATNAGICTWLEFAREIARLEGYEAEVVRPCSSAEFPVPARRPECSILKSTALEATGYPPRPSWQDALALYLEALRSEETR
jgi:dTDP-4-dehydrorhamnose reductase